MIDSVYKKVSYFTNEHNLIKSIARKPALLYRYIRSYPKAKALYKKIVSDVENAYGDKIIWYCCAPVHQNLGDLAQRMCIKKWLEENYPDHCVIEVPTKGILTFKKQVLEAVKKKYSKEQLVVFQSGYTMTDHHPDERVRQIVLDNFSESPILIFPQTILFNDEKKLAKCRDSLKKCSRLLLLTRDRKSYEFAVEHFPGVKTELFPDIVTTLIGTRDHSDKRSGIGLCVRNDGEKYYSYEQIDALKEKLGKLADVSVTDTDCSGIGEITDETIRSAVLDKIDKFAGKELIITDRYHGTIFSLIAETPVIVIKTRDHKVSTGVDWFKNVYDDNVFYCEDIEKVPGLAAEILSESGERKLAPHFKENYYDKLKGMFWETENADL